MYLLNITKIKYPKNDTNVYEYNTIDNLVMELKQFVLNGKINKDDIIRIEEGESNEEYFIDEQYEKMKQYIYNTSDEELKQHYDWYKVDFGDKVELLDSMFESYCSSYDNERLEKEIDKLMEE